MSAQSYARHMADAKRAAALKKRLKSPAVRKKLMTVKKRSENARAALEGIAQRAKFGSGQEKLDAQKSAAIVNLVAKNRARVRAAAQIHAGGLPALLIDKRGRIKPGRFRAMAIPAGMSPDVLYLGPGKPSDSGHFARVSGSPVGSPLIGCGNMPCARCRG